MALCPSSTLSWLQIPFHSRPSFPSHSLSTRSHQRAFFTISASYSTKPSLKSRLRQGERLHGMLLFSSSPTIAEIASLAGYDFLVVDLEHGPGDFSDALDCMRAIQAAGSSTIIRIPENSQTYAKKALDLGPEGIMFPKIETGKSAAEAVSFCRYPPHGIRGCAYSLVRDSNFGFDKNYLNDYRDDRLIMCQVETEKGVTNIQEIMAVDGMDCVTTGPRDLSASLGLLHDPGNDRVKEVAMRLEKAVLESDPANGGAFLAGIANPQDSALDLKKRGYDMVLGTSDISLVSKAVIEDIKAFKIGESGARVRSGELWHAFGGNGHHSGHLN